MLIIKEREKKTVKVLSVGGAGRGCGREGVELWPFGLQGEENLCGDESAGITRRLRLPPIGFEMAVD